MKSLFLIVTNEADNSTATTAIDAEHVIFDEVDNVDYIKTLKGLIKQTSKIGEWDFDEDSRSATNKADEGYVMQIHEATGSPMAQTLAEHAKDYIKTKSYSGNDTKNCGDDLASMLNSLSPDQTMQLAELLLGFDAGFLVQKYAHLNKGSQRMNSGNRIRAAIKNAKITVDDVAAALAKVA